MPESAKSSVTQANPKPNNIFYIWYTELCRRLNSNPAVITTPRSAKSNTILDFAADRLKFEDWNPLINALRLDTSLHVINIRGRLGNYQFLHDVDTEDKARRLRRRFGSLWTDYILNSLVRALSNSLRNTQVLTCLELDGLPMFSQYLDRLLKALKENRTVKIFSLNNCSIQDSGCRSVCLSLQLMPNVDTLNLSKCDLTSISGIYIAKLIKFQQLNRYTTSWHKSLRYSEPDSEKLCGIRRITLNCNPNFGDEGLNHILDELEDDLWIKALDMQRCGITEKISEKLLDILEYNQSLLIADFRQNDMLSPATLERILEILSNRTIFDFENKFQWYASVVSLTPSTSRTYTNKTNYFPRERPLKPKINGPFIKFNPRIPNGVKTPKDFQYRKKFGRNVEVEPKHMLNSVVKTFGKLQLRPCPTNTPNNRNEVSPKDPKKNNNTKSGVKNHKIQNDLTNSASNIFAMLMSSEIEKEDEETSSDDEAKSLMSYYNDCYNNLSTIRENSEKFFKKSDCSNSQMSLYEYMEELSKQQNQDNKNETLKNGRDTKKKFTSKHQHKGKMNGIK